MVFFRFLETFLIFSKLFQNVIFERAGFVLEVLENRYPVSKKSKEQNQITQTHHVGKRWDSLEHLELNHTYVGIAQGAHTCQYSAGRSHVNRETRNASIAHGACTSTEKAGTYACRHNCAKHETHTRACPECCYCSLAFYAVHSWACANRANKPVPLHAYRYSALRCHATKMRDVRHVLNTAD